MDERDQPSPRHRSTTCDKCFPFPNAGFKPHGAGAHADVYNPGRINFERIGNARDLPMKVFQP
jgi:hypothetical protein